MFQDCFIWSFQTECLYWKRAYLASALLQAQSYILFVIDGLVRKEAWTYEITDLVIKITIELILITIISCHLKFLQCVRSVKNENIINNIFNSIHYPDRWKALETKIVGLSPGCWWQELCAWAGSPWPTWPSPSPCFSSQHLRQECSTGKQELDRCLFLPTVWQKLFALKIIENGLIKQLLAHRAS